MAATAPGRKVQTTAGVLAVTCWSAVDKAARYAAGDWSTGSTKRVKKEVATNVLVDDNLCIPPRAADHRVEHSARLEHDMLLVAMFPHMHLRGKSFRYEAEYPDGTTEILLDVPRYDFNWQHRYVLAEPKRLPAGTVLRCSAQYDNSAGNPNNPDPAKYVTWGEQSWDEMMIGFFEYYWADETEKGEEK